MNKDTRLHREKSANKNLFRTSRKKSHVVRKPKGWFFGKSGDVKYLIESPIVVHAK
jgi:hypothetical protein